MPNERPKKLWINPLRPDARERLCAKHLAPEHAAGETIGKGAPLPLSARQLQPLAKALRAVPDPRAKNRQNLIGPLLSLIALGLLCGGTSLSAIVRHAQRLTPAQLRLLGIRGKRRAPGSKVWIYTVPNYEVFRDLLCRIDLDAFARILSEWLSAHRGTLPSHFALDGKRVRGELGTIVCLRFARPAGSLAAGCLPSVGSLCDIDEKVPVALAATTAPGGEQTCARDMIRRESTVLTGSTVSADALFTNSENARLIVQEKGGDYLLSVKDNQPTLEQHLRGQLQSAPLLPIRQRAATAR